MFPLKRLSKLVATAGAISLSFASSSASALQLRILSNPLIVDGGRDDLARDTRNFIRFSKRIGSLQIGGSLYADQFRGVELSNGLRVDGNVLNLTNVSINNQSNRRFNTPLNVPFFNFSNLFISSPLAVGNVYAYQILKGEFDSNDINNPRGRNNVSLIGTVDGRLIANQVANPPADIPYDFDRRASKILLNLGREQLIRGRLTSLTLEPRFRLTLDRSACMVLANQPIEAGDAERICDRAAGVPEPSSVISLLALGIFGGGFLLKRQRKSSDS